MSENVIYADLNLTESTRPRLQKITDVQGSTYAEVKVQSLDTNAAVSYTSSDHPTASSPPDSKTFSTTYEETLGCPPYWEKKGKKCYFFSEIQVKKDWNASRKECTDMNSDLVIIDNKEELHYLTSQSRGHYYLLGLTYSKSEKKWKWINNVEHSTDMFTIGGDLTDYFCTVVGHGKVETAACGGSSTTQNMCEKAANISERQKES
ncbi:PREDICTED: C-type lectin domain family 5 member A-like [Fulmarus glacialis]|uniref:C-type lectin domain family 5 member A-like n=1 Tax=Fulmarus glacialis TaxID=30455 RepID=UPI00051B6727|nr:PREDICTED: C-type lectin domain family 5 member A-like [Fulmarus glacialis]